MVARATVIVLSHFHVCERDRYSACIAHLQQRSSQSHPQHGTHLWWHPHTPTLSLFREKPVHARTTSASDEEKGKMNWPFWSKHPLSLRLAPQRQVPLFPCLPLPHATVLQRRKKTSPLSIKILRAHIHTSVVAPSLFLTFFNRICKPAPPPTPPPPSFPTTHTQTWATHCDNPVLLWNIWKQRLACKVNEISNVA